MQFDQLKRRDFITLLGGAAAVIPLTRAVAQRRPVRIGWLVFGGATLGPIDQSLKDALAERGLVDGRSIELLYRYANGVPAELPNLAQELVAQKPDLLLAIGGDIIKALFDASKGTIPIAGAVSDSPMRAGIAASLARPSKNFTGLTFLTDEMAEKRMELLKDVVPSTRRVAAIFNPQHLDDEMRFARRGADSLGIELTAYCGAIGLGRSCLRGCKACSGIRSSENRGCRRWPPVRASGRRCAKCIPAGRPRRR